MLDFVLERGIILRGVADQYGSDGWFRVTIGSEEENRMLVNVVREFFGME